MVVPGRERGKGVVCRVWGDEEKLQEVYWRRRRLGERGHGFHPQVFDICREEKEGVPGDDEGSRRRRGGRGRGGTRAIGRRGPRAARSSGALAMAVAPCRR